MSGKTPKAAAPAAAPSVNTPATLEEAIALLNEANAKLKDADQKIADTEKAYKEAEDKSEALKAELEDAAAVIEELKAQAAQSTGKSKGPVVKIGQQSYLVKAGTVLGGKPFTAADIAADKDLCKDLIERGSKLLIAID